MLNIQVLLTSSALLVQKYNTSNKMAHKLTVTLHM